MTDLRRRDLLVGTALVIVGEKVARGSIISGHLPWAPVAESHPAPPTADSWLFFTNAEAAMVESIADRIIPPDPQTPGGKDAGCAAFIDRQLAGPYGQRRRAGGEREPSARRARATYGRRALNALRRRRKRRRIGLRLPRHRLINAPYCS
jgi:hypothetical protein